jgi:hypothetical protein
MPPAPPPPPPTAVSAFLHSIPEPVWSLFWMTFFVVAFFGGCVGAVRLSRVIRGWVNDWRAARKAEAAAKGGGGGGGGSSSSMSSSERFLASREKQLAQRQQRCCCCFPYPSILNRLLPARFSGDAEPQPLLGKDKETPKQQQQQQQSQPPSTQRRCCWCLPWPPAFGQRPHLASETDQTKLPPPQQQPPPHAQKCCSCLPWGWSGRPSPMGTAITEGPELRYAGRIEVEATKASRSWPPEPESGEFVRWEVSCRQPCSVSSASGSGSGKHHEAAPTEKRPVVPVATREAATMTPRRQRHGLQNQEEVEVEVEVEVEGQERDPFEPRQQGGAQSRVEDEEESAWRKLRTGCQSASPRSQPSQPPHPPSRYSEHLYAREGLSPLQPPRSSGMMPLEAAHHIAATAAAAAAAAAAVAADRAHRNDADAYAAASQAAFASATQTQELPPYWDPSAPMPMRTAATNHQSPGSVSTEVQTSLTAAAIDYLMRPEPVRTPPSPDSPYWAYRADHSTSRPAAGGGSGAAHVAQQDAALHALPPSAMRSSSRTPPPFSRVSPPNREPPRAVRASSPQKGTPSPYSPHSPQRLSSPHRKASPPRKPSPPRAPSPPREESGGGPRVPSPPRESRATRVTSPPRDPPPPHEPGPSGLLGRPAEGEASASGSPAARVAGVWSASKRTPTGTPASSGGKQTDPAPGAGLGKGGSPGAVQSPNGVSWTRVDVPLRWGGAANVPRLRPYGAVAEEEEEEPPRGSPTVRSTPGSEQQDTPRRAASGSGGRSGAVGSSSRRARSPAARAPLVQPAWQD